MSLKGNGSSEMVVICPQGGKGNGIGYGKAGKLGRAVSGVRGRVMGQVSKVESRGKERERGKGYGEVRESCFRGWRESDGKGKGSRNRGQEKGKGYGRKAEVK